ncbi:helix-turn-helix domain-containing protein [Neobacillus sp. 3P2-tot-E-2]|uniref:helix-turn-helix domain-containing protein n=1 Tax=Neobacillus sp. 3P2-tot-E-2 TaxID=3132212 RepID=UPI0039A0BDE1
MKNTNLDDLEYITKLFFELFNIPLFIFDHQGTLLFQVPNQNIESPFYTQKNSWLYEVHSEKKQPDMPAFFQSPYLENYFSISLPTNGLRDGFLIAGPVLNMKLSDEAIISMENDFYQMAKRQEIKIYYLSLPVIKKIDFIHMSCALYYMIYGKKVDIAEVFGKQNLEETNEVKIEEPIVQISEKRQNEKATINTLTEKKLFSLIKAGKKDELLQTLTTQYDMESGQLSKRSYIRNMKNLAIAGITLATRAAVEGGLNEIIAYNLSDSLIQNLEELNDLKSVGEFTGKSLLKFAELVENKKKHKYSKPVSTCQSYIFANLYKEITLSQLAKLVGMNASYLSVLFKKEVGFSISEFIHREKVEEAKNLMTFTNHSISEISTILNFHDQSHFTRVFKKIAGMTPKQFYIKKIGQ